MYNFVSGDLVQVVKLMRRLTVFYSGSEFGDLISIVKLVIWLLNILLRTLER